MPSNQGIIRDNKGKFVRGSSGNPTGKNAGRPPQLVLEEALLKAQRTHNKSFLDHFIERAYTNDTVAIALAKKIIPDKLESTGLNAKLIFQDIKLEGSIEDVVADFNTRFASQFRK